MKWPWNNDDVGLEGGPTIRRTKMNVGDALKSLLELAKNDVLKGALPALAAFFTNVAGNTSAVNITVQLAKLQVDLLAALPTVEKDLLGAIAQMITEQVSSLPK